MIVLDFSENSTFYDFFSLHLADTFSVMLGQNKILKKKLISIKDIEAFNGKKCVVINFVICLRKII